MDAEGVAIKGNASTSMNYAIPPLGSATPTTVSAGAEYCLSSVSL